MIDNTIRFNQNWNGKLNNKAFTTIRIHNPKKYIIGNVYSIELSAKPIGKAVLQGKRVLRIDQLNDFICFLDTGYCRNEAIAILQRMYKDVNLQNVLFDFCLMVYQKREKQEATQTRLEL